MIINWGIHLNSEIRNRLNSEIWQSPAIIYSRMVSLEPGMLYQKKDLITLLESTHYRNVSHIMHSGEFSVKGDTIFILRRPFNFPDNKEGKIYVRITFNTNHDKLIEIKNVRTGRNFAFFRLDPCLINMLQSSNGKQRFFVPKTGFPDLLINTLINTEDRRFYQHDGISPHSIGRAFLANIIAGRAIQGGSTLTQQLVKNLFLTNERSIWRKIREVYMAIIMDASYSKDYILELYLNEVYLGQVGNIQIRGFPLASLCYFNRSLNELSLDQQAMLVGMVKGASLYNPWRNLKISLQRRNLVLYVLQQHKVIDKNLYTMLSTRPLKVQPKDRAIIAQPAFMQILRNELKIKLGRDKMKDLSSMKIFTTLDPISQHAAEKAVREGIPILKKQYILKDLESAMVIVDRFSGELRAIVGGSNPQFAGYNRATQARRSIGSLAKPATYLTALSQPDIYRLNSLISNQPITMKQPNGTLWKPMNNNHLFSNKVMLVDALINSMNIPTINLGMTLGLDVIIDHWIKLGIPKDQLHPVPAILLGSLNLTPIEVAQAFQSIASGGNRAKLSVIRSVIDKNGDVLYQSFPQSKRVEPEQAVYLTLYAMQEVINHGTARALGARYPNAHLAGKTGTTNDLVDSWFAGIDGKEVAITWVGRDNNQTAKLYGANGAMQIYRRYLDNQPPMPLILKPPQGITYMHINSSGNFVCNQNTLRTLPVWILDPKQICQKQKKNQKDTKKYDHNITDWIKEMFYNS
ncbi:MrcB protein [Candidatus Pantoea carbekii]|uniref:Penicillin-binding protein 1B n=1 Tax=Candidatus Pantoea carbekii TaxID=1235990 RepID=U3U7X4_9GAMM|nr:MrcB protein [Candidatus Pantoea carbekii]